MKKIIGVIIVILAFVAGIYFGYPYVKTLLREASNSISYDVAYTFETSDGQKFTEAPFRIPEKTDFWIHLDFVFKNQIEEDVVANVEIYLYGTDTFKSNKETIGDATPEITRANFMDTDSIRYSGISWVTPPDQSFKKSISIKQQSDEANDVFISIIVKAEGSTDEMSRQAFKIDPLPTIPALPAPQNLKISGNILSWDPVPNAIGYYIYDDNQNQIEVPVTNNFYDLYNLDSSGNTTISVAGRGDGVNFKDAGIRSSIHFERLEAPALSFNKTGNGLSWTSVDNVSSYRLYYSGTEYKEYSNNKTSLSVSEIKKLGRIGNISFRVVAYSTNSQIASSNKSEPISLDVLGKPSISYNGNKSRIEWNKIPKADSYDIYVDNVCQKTVTSINDVISFEITDVHVGKMIYVVAKGGDYVIDSDSSDAIII